MKKEIWRILSDRGKVRNREGTLALKGERELRLSGKGKRWDFWG